MKKFFYSLAALSLLMACTPEENGADNNQSGNGGNKIVHVTGISLDRNSATIKEGEYITLVATVTPSNADNKFVSWSSSSDAVATVDNSGRVVARGKGKATITAKTFNGKKAKCKVTVKAAPTYVTANVGGTFLWVGRSMKIEPVLSPGRGGSVSIVSSNPSVVQISGHTARSLRTRSR